MTGSCSGGRTEGGTLQSWTPTPPSQSQQQGEHIWLRMGNKAAKHKVTAEDMEFLMSKVQDPSGTEAGTSTFYKLNFTDSGHTKARIQVRRLKM